MVDRVEQLRQEKALLTRELEVLRSETCQPRRDPRSMKVLKDMVRILEEQLLQERNKHQRSASKREQEYNLLLDEIEDLKASERKLKSRVKSLTSELAIYKKGRVTPVGQPRSGSVLGSDHSHGEERRSTSNERSAGHRLRSQSRSHSRGQNEQWGQRNQRIGSRESQRKVLRDMLSSPSSAQRGRTFSRATRPADRIQEDPLQCETSLTTQSAKKLEEFHQLKSEKSELAWNERNVSVTAEPGQSQSASTSICSEFTSSPSISKLTKSSVFTFAHKSPSTFPCSRCEMSFNTHLALDDHLNNCGRERPSRQRRIPSRLRQSPSPPVSKRNSTLKDPYSVEVELEDFSSFQSWNSSRGKLSCKTCGKVFKRPKMFQLHNIRCSERPADLGQSRPEVRNHICNVCGKAFLQRGHLTEHEATHSNIRRFSCSTCGKKFIRNRELKIHEARHEGQATYHCQFCGHASYRKSGHYHHLITHLTKPQVICQTCFHICDTPMLLKEHELEHRHTCERCGVKFRLKKELLTHYDSCR
ncbi:ZBTB1 protein, partial [Polypterus senegalus]